MLHGAKVNTLKGISDYFEEEIHTISYTENHYSNFEIKETWELGKYYTYHNKFKFLLIVFSLNFLNYYNYTLAIYKYDSLLQPGVGIGPDGPEPDFRLRAWTGNRRANQAPGRPMPTLLTASSGFL